MKRLTITLDDDLYAMVRAHAVASGLSISRAVGDLMRRRGAGLESGESGVGRPRPGDDFGIDPETLLPVVACEGRAITNEEVRRAIEDDDERILEGFARGAPRRRELKARS